MRAIVLFSLFGLVAAAALAQPPAPTGPAPAAPGVQVPAAAAGEPIDCEDFDPARTYPDDRLQALKLCQEILKLQEEVKTLSSGPLGSIGQWLPPVVGAIVGFLATIVGFSFQRSMQSGQKKKTEIETEKLKLEADKLKQERLISLMAGLGAEKLPQQFGAASALFQRAEEALTHAGPMLLHIGVAGSGGPDSASHHDRDEALQRTVQQEAAAEFRTLAKVLVTLIRAADLDQKVTKYIAEEIAGLFRLRGRKSAEGLPDVCNLATHSLQNAKLIDVFWADVFAEGVDFFGADLTKSSFRRARLAGAIFYEATLDGVVFRDADLTGVNFTGAKGLGSADFRGADLSGASFANVEGFASARLDAQTRWNDKTVWPQGFTPPARG